MGSEPTRHSAIAGIVYSCRSADTIHQIASLMPGLVVYKQVQKRRFIDRRSPFVSYVSRHGFSRARKHRIERLLEFGCRSPDETQEAASALTYELREAEMGASVVQAI